jgi:hypothetical protein
MLATSNGLGSLLVISLKAYATVLLCPVELVDLDDPMYLSVALLSVSDLLAKTSYVTYEQAHRHHQDRLRQDPRLAVIS